MDLENKVLLTLWEVTGGLGGVLGREAGGVLEREAPSPPKLFAYKIHEYITIKLALLV